jgi:hypothetical protein
MKPVLVHLGLCVLCALFSGLATPAAAQTPASGLPAAANKADRIEKRPAARTAKAQGTAPKLAAHTAVTRAAPSAADPASAAGEAAALQVARSLPTSADGFEYER